MVSPRSGWPPAIFMMPISKSSSFVPTCPRAGFHSPLASHRDCHSKSLLSSIVASLSASPSSTIALSSAPPRLPSPSWIRRSFAGCSPISVGSGAFAGGSISIPSPDDPGLPWLDPTLPFNVCLVPWLEPAVLSAVGLVAVLDAAVDAAVGSLLEPDAAVGTWFASVVALPGPDVAVDVCPLELDAAVDVGPGLVSTFRGLVRRSPSAAASWPGPS